MRLIGIVALLANVAALAWVIYMVSTFVPLPREWLLAGVMIAFPLLNIIALAGLLRRSRS